MYRIQSNEVLYNIEIIIENRNIIHLKRDKLFSPKLESAGLTPLQIVANDILPMKS